MCRWVTPTCPSDKFCNPHTSHFFSCIPSRRFYFCSSDQKKTTFETVVSLSIEYKYLRRRSKTFDPSRYPKGSTQEQVIMSDFALSSRVATDIPIVSSPRSVVWTSDRRLLVEFAFVFRYARRYHHLYIRVHVGIV